MSLHPARVPARRPMRANFFQSADDRVLGLLNPRRVVRRLSRARFSVAASIYVAAIRVWQDTEPENTLVASLAFALTMIVTVPSAIWTEVQRTRTAVACL